MNIFSIGTFSSHQVSQARNSQCDTAGEADLERSANGLPTSFNQEPCRAIAYREILPYAMSINVMERHHDLFKN
jgi:hypothetical protein